MDIQDLTPLQWALVVVLLLLAMAGIWHIGARLAGYKVLPFYQRSACGTKMHQLAYITEQERFDLIKRAKEKDANSRAGEPQPGTQGVPCYTDDWEFKELPPRLAAHEKKWRAAKTGEREHNMVYRTPDDEALAPDAFPEIDLSGVQPGWWGSRTYELGVLLFLATAAWKAVG